MLQFSQFTSQNSHYTYNMYASSSCVSTPNYINVTTQLCINSFLKTPTSFRFCKLHFQAKAVKNAEDMAQMEAKEEERPKSKWVRIGPEISEAQKQDIAKLPAKMSNRCKALMKQIICFDSEESDLSVLLKEWAKSTTPRRADWLIILKELCAMNHPMYLQVFYLPFSFGIVILLKFIYFLFIMLS